MGVDPEFARLLEADPMAAMGMATGRLMAGLPSCRAHLVKIGIAAEDGEGLFVPALRVGMPTLFDTLLWMTLSTIAIGRARGLEVPTFRKPEPDTFKHAAEWDLRNRGERGRDLFYTRLCAREALRGIQLVDMVKGKYGGLTDDPATWVAFDRALFFIVDEFDSAMVSFQVIAAGLGIT